MKTYKVCKSAILLGPQSLLVGVHSLNTCIAWSFGRIHTMIGEHRQLVTDEPVELRKKPVEVQDCRKLPIIFEEFVGYIPQFNNGEPEDVNM